MAKGMTFRRIVRFPSVAVGALADLDTKWEKVAKLNWGGKIGACLGRGRKRR